MYRPHPIGLNMPNQGVGNYAGIQPQNYAAQIQAPQQRPRNQRALVGFGNVPKFIPPTYDNVDPNDLPCPETPSPRGSLVDEDEQQAYLEEQQKQSQYLGTREPRQSGRTSRHGGGSESQSQSRKSRTVEDKSPTTGAATGLKDNKPFPAGSFVEYRSRTMHDRWILAKVEAYDEKNRVYKLDVQPKAPMDRVRLRPGNSNSQGSRSQHSQQPAPEESPSHQERQELQEQQPVQQMQQQQVSPKKSPNKMLPQLHDVVDPFAENEHLDQIQRMQRQIHDLTSENLTLKQQLELERDRVRMLEQQLQMR